MATILDLFALGELKAAAKPAPSVGAKHVGSQVQDPFGQTKQLFDDVHKKKMDYELSKQNLITQTAPTRAVLDRVSQIHNLDQAPVSMNTGPMPQTPMGPDGMPMDQTGMQMRPGMPPAGGGMQPGQPNMGNRMNDPLGSDPAMGQEVNQGKAGMQMDPATRNPQNMAQTPGQMNQNRPSKAGFQPGVSPGPAQSVVPRKMGVPQPGESNVGQKAGYPGGQASNPQAEQYGPAAAKPKGAGKLPGAKGPGDPKVQNKIKKAQNNPNRGSGGESTAKQINIKIHGDAIQGGRDNMASMLSTAALNSCDSGKMMKSEGTSEGADKGWDTRGRGRNKSQSVGTYQPDRKFRPMWTPPADKDKPKEPFNYNPAEEATKYNESKKDNRPEWTHQEYKSNYRTGPGHPDLEAREFTQGKRKQLAKTGAAMPGGGFPIVNKSDLANARQAVGRAKNPGAARAHIRNRAKALGVHLPSTWKKEMAAFTGGIMPHGTVGRPAGGAMPSGAPSPSGTAVRPTSGGMPTGGTPTGGGARPAMPSGGGFGGGMIRPMMRSRGMKFKMTNLTQE